jgi:hypothetical protein
VRFLQWSVSRVLVFPRAFSYERKSLFEACFGMVLPFRAENGLSHACKASAFALVLFVKMMQSI